MDVWKTVLHKLIVFRFGLGTVSKPGTTEVGVPSSDHHSEAVGIKAPNGRTSGVRQWSGAAGGAVNGGHCMSH